MKRKVIFSLVCLCGAILFGSCSSKEYYLEHTYAQQVIKIPSSGFQTVNLNVGEGLKEDEGIMISYNVNKDPAFSTAKSNGDLNLWAQTKKLAEEEWNAMGKEYYPVIKASSISVPSGDDNGLVISLIDGEGKVYAKESNKTQGVFSYYGETKFLAGLGLRLENTNSFAAINVAVEVVAIKYK
ncbi:MAG: hypothetical protein J6U04_04615 [Salinivirgaceae bacterium]|nr:hypothetical protein [Salinivirgaceae bacterium]